MSTHKITIDAVRTALSAARIATYESAASIQGDDDPSALVLYAWNAEVSGALLAPLHICEVVVRNAVADALEAVYGPCWPWHKTFERSLPSPPQGYSPQRDLRNARRSVSTTGKVIPELKFVFWQKMFTRRYDARIWDKHLQRVMPNLDPKQSLPMLRESIYKDLEQIRLLRNRIAHHEPIFNRNLTDDYQNILKLVRYRCIITAEWMDNNQQAVTAINAKP